jgi:hypothetical protein
MVVNGFKGFINLKPPIQGSSWDLNPSIFEWLNKLTGKYKK